MITHSNTGRQQQGVSYLAEIKKGSVGGTRGFLRSLDEVGAGEHATFRLCDVWGKLLVQVHGKQVQEDLRVRGR